MDMYVKIETVILDYFRNNQKAIRVELYQGIIDNVKMVRIVFIKLVDH